MRARAEEQVAIETHCPPAQLLVRQAERHAPSFVIEGCGFRHACEVTGPEAVRCERVAPEITAR